MLNSVDPKTDAEAIIRLGQFDNDFETVTKMYVVYRSIPLTVVEAYHKVLDDVLGIKLNAVREFDKRQISGGNNE